MIKNPDYTIKLPKRIKIPATGFMPYQKFTIKPHFPEEKWVKEIEFITKPKVLHHVIFEIQNPNKTHKKSRHLLGDYVVALPRTGWAPGHRKHRPLPENTGIRIPKNAEIKLEVHYEPIGKELIDDTTEIRFVFYKNPPKYRRISLQFFDSSLRIPPGASNYKTETTYHLKEAVLLTGVTSHMHLRGKASSLVVIEPSGLKKVIFSLDPYNFNFQRAYIFKNPLKILRNSTIKCINWFDNSAKNLVNPDFKQTVLWGLKTIDEMSECWLSVAVPISPNSTF